MPLGKDEDKYNPVGGIGQLERLVSSSRTILHFRFKVPFDPHKRGCMCGGREKRNAVHCLHDKNAMTFSPGCLKRAQ